MTRQELEDRLLDYLYDEMEPSQRTAFERALPAHPEVMREVEAHQATRRAYRALPREAIPSGLLDGVLAEADKEAAKRAGQGAEAADAPDKRLAVAAGGAARPTEALGFWERLRRLVFQPAFAMAMAVLVVAGISLVGQRKDEQLPGMGPASDAQHIPPVAVSDEIAQSKARGAGGEGGDGRQASSPLGGAQATAASDDQEAEEQAAAAEQWSVAEPAAAEAPRLLEGDAVVAGKPTAQPRSTAEPRSNDAPRPKAARVDTDMPGEKAGFATDSMAKNEPAKPAKVALGNTNGTLGEVVDLFSAKEDVGGTVALDDDPRERRDPNTPDVAGRQWLEPAVKDVGDVDGAPPSDKTKTDSARAEPRKATSPAGPPPPVEKPASPPVREAESGLAKKQPPADEPAADRDRDELVTPETAEEAPRAPERTIATTEGSRTRAPAEEDKKESRPAPTLTPPAPSPETLFETYKKQAAAGAFADAQRSLDALARLEGETKRVRTARVELEKLRAAARQPVVPSATRQPPETPGSPPD